MCIDICHGTSAFIFDGAQRWPSLWRHCARPDPASHAPRRAFGIATSERPGLGRRTAGLRLEHAPPNGRQRVRCPRHQSAASRRKQTSQRDCSNGDEAEVGRHSSPCCCISVKPAARNTRRLSRAWGRSGSRSACRVYAQAPDPAHSVATGHVIRMSARAAAAGAYRPEKPDCIDLAGSAGVM